MVTEPLMNQLLNNVKHQIFYFFIGTYLFHAVPVNIKSIHDMYFIKNNCIPLCSS